jgi:TPP-dependent pyruvate/acetoin dehydrogenase alpha subunit
MNVELMNLIKEEYDIKNSKVQMFVNLQLIRSVELLISDKYSDQIFRCPVHLSIGQEAVAVGVSLNLQLEDKVVSTHRSHAHYIAKGGDVSSMLSELIGSPLGCCKGRGGSMHIFDKSVGFMASVPIVGSSLPIAAGLALAEKLFNSKNIVVAYVGDAALETGAFYESLNLAALKKLPILIILEDNGYSTYSNKKVRWPDAKNVRATIEGMGLIYENGNGDDVEEIYTQVGRISSDVRDNKPSLLHLNTFRRYEHCGPNLDDSMGYRESDEIDSYSARDPLEILRNKMIISGVISEIILEKLAKQINDYAEGIFLRVLDQNRDFLAQFEMIK